MLTQFSHPDRRTSNTNCTREGDVVRPGGGGGGGGIPLSGPLPFRGRGTP